MHQPNFHHFCTIAILLLAASHAYAASTWSATASGNWSLGTNWGGTAPASGTSTQLIFSGTAATYTATDDIGSGTFTLNNLSVTNTGATTIAPLAAANSLTFGGSSPALTVSSGSGAATISNAIIFAASTSVTNSSNSALTLGPASGTGITFGNNMTFTNSGSGSIVLKDGGTYAGSNVTVNLSNSATGTFTIGNMSPVSGTLNINAGTVKFAGSTSGDLFGNSLTLNVASGATFDFAANGETMGAVTGGGTIICSTGSAGVNTQITGNLVWAGNFASAGTSTFTVGVSGENYTFTGNNTNTNTYSTVAGSSLTLGDGGTSGSVAGNIANAGSLIFNRSDSPVYAKAISGAGPVTQKGSGTLTFSGTNTYTGNTNVTAGTLAIATAASLPTGSTTVTVSSGAVLDVSAVSGGYSFGPGRTLIAGRTTTPATDINGSITVGGATPAVLDVGGVGTVAATTVNGSLTLNNAIVKFDVNATPASAFDAIAVNGNLTLSGISVFNVSPLGGQAPSGTYTLITYTGTLTGTAANLVSSRGYTFDLSTPGQVKLVTPGTPANLTWVGNAANNVWDVVTTENFSGAYDGDNRFYNFDNVTFDATGLGGSTAVTLSIPVYPGTMTVAGSQNYTFGGTGASLNGIGAGTFSGSGTVTLGVPTVFSGGTNVTNGTVAFTTGGTLSGNVSVNGGSLNCSLASSVTGPLTVTSGSVTGSIANSITGNVALNGGTLQIVDNTDVLSTATITFNGGTLQAVGLYSTGSGVQPWIIGAGGGTFDNLTGQGTTQFGNNGTSSLAVPAKTETRYPEADR